MAIVTGSGRTLGNDIVNLDEVPNEKRVDEQVSGKRKRLDKSNEKVTMQKEQCVEKSRMVEEKSDRRNTTSG